MHTPTREKTAARGYGSKWQTARAAFLKKHPLCCRCAETGHVVAATVVDHIEPHRGDKALFWDRSNWQPLCKTCHDRKTATEDDGFGRAGRARRSFGVDGLPIGDAWE